MAISLETLSWIASIVAVPVAVIGWFVSAKWKTNKAVASKGGIATSGDVRADGAGIVAGHNSPVSFNLSVGVNRQGADTYEKRYAVLQSTRAFLNELAGHRLISDGTLRTIGRNAADAPLLFDDGLAAYIQELFDRAAKVQSITIAMEGLPVGIEKAAASREAGKHRQWLLEQADILTEKFRPVLQLD
jgi:hypothetical protein